jgi:hypothetical protein
MLSQVVIGTRSTRRQHTMPSVLFANVRIPKRIPCCFAAEADPECKWEEVKERERESEREYEGRSNANPL